MVRYEAIVEANNNSSIVIVDSRGEIILNGEPVSPRFALELAVALANAVKAVQSMKEVDEILAGDR